MERMGKYLASGLVGLAGLVGTVRDTEVQNPLESAPKVNWREALPETVNPFWRVAFTDRAIVDLDYGIINEEELMGGNVPGIEKYFRNLHKFSVYDSDSKVNMLTQEELENPDFRRSIDDWVRGTDFEKKFDLVYFSQGTKRQDGSFDCPSCVYSIPWVAVRAYELDRDLDDLRVGSAYFVVGPLKHPLGPEAVYKSMFNSGKIGGVPQIGFAVHTDKGWEVVEESISNIVQKVEPEKIREWVKEARNN